MLGAKSSDQADADFLTIGHSVDGDHTTRFIPISRKGPRG